MAGKALRKRILTEVASNGGADWLFDQIASGVTVAELARQYGCTRSYVSRSLNSVPEYAAALTKARGEAADALVEQGLEMVDGLSGASSPTEIAATREKVQWRKFMAGSMNQERYGTRPQSNVTLSIGDLHLDALRKFSADMKRVNSDAEAATIDAEYVEVSDE
jgi:transposase-like protein